MDDLDAWNACTVLMNQMVEAASNARFHGQTPAKLDEGTPVFLCHNLDIDAAD